MSTRPARRPRRSSPEPTAPSGRTLTRRHAVAIAVATVLAGGAGTAAGRALSPDVAVPGGDCPSPTDCAAPRPDPSDSAAAAAEPAASPTAAGDAMPQLVGRPWSEVAAEGVPGGTLRVRATAVRGAGPGVVVAQEPPAGEPVADVTTLSVRGEAAVVPLTEDAAHLSAEPATDPVGGTWPDAVALSPEALTAGVELAVPLGAATLGWNGWADGARANTVTVLVTDDTGRRLHRAVLTGSTVRRLRLPVVGGGRLRVHADSAPVPVVLGDPHWEVVR